MIEPIKNTLINGSSPQTIRHCNTLLNPPIQQKIYPIPPEQILSKITKISNNSQILLTNVQAKISEVFFLL